jgi:hypothetical protein
LKSTMAKSESLARRPLWRPLSQVTKPPRAKFAVLYADGAPEERRRQSPERSVIPEEFGRPAKHFDTSKRYQFATGREVDSAVVRLACNAPAGRPGLSSSRSASFRLMALGAGPLDRCGPTATGRSTQPASSQFRDQVDAPLQLVLQFRDIHPVRDAIGVADALHIALLNQFFQTPHYGYAWQLQRVRDLTCANGRAHDRAQEGRWVR